SPFRLRQSAATTWPGAKHCLTSLVYRLIGFIDLWRAPLTRALWAPRARTVFGSCRSSPPAASNSAPSAAARRAVPASSLRPQAGGIRYSALQGSWWTRLSSLRPAAWGARDRRDHGHRFFPVERLKGDNQVLLFSLRRPVEVCAADLCNEARVCKLRQRF